MLHLMPLFVFVVASTSCVLNLTSTSQTDQGNLVTLLAVFSSQQNQCSTANHPQTLQLMKTLKQILLSHKGYACSPAFLLSFPAFTLKQGPCFSSGIKAICCVRTHHRHIQSCLVEICGTNLYIYCKATSFYTKCLTVVTSVHAQSKRSSLLIRTFNFLFHSTRSQENNLPFLDIPSFRFLGEGCVGFTFSFCPNISEVRVFLP